MNPPHKYRVLIVASHPVQYASPLFREMAAHPRLEIQVAYCSLQGAEEAVDPEFGVRVAWDVPLLEGYPWVHVPNRSSRPGPGRFFGLRNPGLWSLARGGKFDAVIILTGYVYASFWIAIAAAKWTGCPILFGTDAHQLFPLDGKRWKVPIKRFFWPLLFRLADTVIVPSTGGVGLIRSLGIPADRIILTPYVVNNAWWIEQARQCDREAVRRGWSIPGSAHVVLFCAKLQPWKRPMDLLEAFAKLEMPEAYLVIAGEGPLRAKLEQHAKDLGIAARVRFPGFVNQTQVPGLYVASDLFVLPSEYEAFGVVVNEAMLCGCPVVVSDRVGARYDLIREGTTGMVYPCGDVEALSNVLRALLGDPARLRAMSEVARKRMESWAPDDNINGLVAAVERAVSRRAGVRAPETVASK
jgi:glycosyltransferase involved in cell wall biosynthesis